MNDFYPRTPNYAVIALVKLIKKCKKKIKESKSKN